MEFGVFINGYLPGQAAHDPACEHEMLTREISYAIEADKHNWKYVWVGEHHALTEYSHMSAPEVVMGYLAHATERIHIGTGIMNLSPRVNHPVRSAERVAMLDHLLEGRFEWGTGRGAGSHEIASFNILDKNSTKPEWNEVIREIPRMWEEKDYMFEGEHFTVPYPHNILPKPYRGQGHPPIWVGCGNPATFTQAGELGIGAIAFNFEPIYNLKGRIAAYKEGIANCTEPLGQFKNDNVMMTNAVICLSDRKKAREVALRRGRGYLYSLVCNYHDTIPHQDGVPVWPEPPTPLPTRACSTTSSSRGGCCAASPTRWPSRSPSTGRSAATSWCSACRRTRSSTTRSSRCSRCSEPRSSRSSTRTPFTRPPVTGRRHGPGTRPSTSRCRTSPWRSCRPTP